MKIVPGRLRRIVRRVIGRTAPSDRPSPPSPVPPPVPDLNLAMIVGAQRSGTTWLQLLCAAHPKVAGGEELHLFSRYLGHVVSAYYKDRRDYAEAGRAQGLPCLLSRDEFDGTVKQFATTVLSKLVRCKSGAELAIEKTPDHVLHLHYIRHLFPKLKVIHVIRDPRDVVVSQLAAAASWGEDWAPKTPADAAQRWVDWVSAGRKQAGPPDRYLEVRYETLLSDGPRELARLYDFLGYPLPMEQVERIYSQFTMASIKSGQAPKVLVTYREGPAGKPGAAAQGAAAGGGGGGAKKKGPEGFFRKGKAGGWRESLSEEEIRTVERIAAPLMSELGYAPADLAPAPATEPAAAASSAGLVE